MTDRQHADEIFIQDTVARLMGMMEWWISDHHNYEQFKQEMEQVLFYEIRQTYVTGKAMKGFEVHNTIMGLLEAAPQ